MQVVSFARKLLQGPFILQAIGILLIAIGYKKDAVVQTEQTLFYLHWVFVSLPLVFILLGFYFSLKFALNRRNFHLLQQEVLRLENGDISELDCYKTRDLCRLFTVKSYKALIDS